MKLSILKDQLKQAAPKYIYWGFFGFVVWIAGLIYGTVMFGWKFTCAVALVTWGDSLMEAAFGSVSQRVTKLETKEAARGE